MCAHEIFLCASRNRVGPVGSLPEADHWVRRPNGDRTCSFCGSLHEQDFIEILEAYADGKDGYHFDPSTKSYKRYANRPGVRNAGDGGIKFYGWHCDPTPGAELDRRIAIHDRAMDRFRRDLRNRTGEAPG